LYVISALAVILPSYLPPQTLPLDADIPNRIDVYYAGGLELVGYELRPNRAKPGAQFDVTLYWKRGSDDGYYQFALSGHNLAGEPIISRTVSPLALRYPTTAWPKDRIVTDRIRLLTSSDLAQTIGTVYLEVFDGHQGITVSHVDRAGSPLAKRLALGQIAIGLHEGRD
jgi:hypothetical protein